jgi:F-type H+-transporting ATPase subunit b
MEHGSDTIGEVFNFGMLHLEWPTALFVFVLFILTMIVLNSLLFKPIIRTLESRQSQIDKDKEESGKLAKNLETSERDYQGKLSDVRETIQKSHQQAIDEAHRKTNQMVESAKEAVSAKIADATKELDSERANALKEASSLTKELSQLIKSKVLA